ncbi:DENN domain-containing protein 3-like isoform X2 [Corticium candelabrum]|uniref:DENN domain-containing protein 3-like isoform X2 n=1 Tax=Corticium candelabrum TaxID=121492 RepID=UPI002E25ABB3|nr:DENN domain-containing protein 3-like isoform X2 [Corticium candelabrum]
MDGKGYGRLHNAFVELCVVVGMDEDTGLVFESHLDSDSQFSTTETETSPVATLTSCSYLPFVLAAVSGEVGNFPKSGCPPVETFVTDCSSQPCASKSNRLRKRSESMLTRQATLSPSAALVKTPELPLSSEEIEGLPSFCLPESARVFTEKPPAQCHSFVMTDLLGMHRYTMCLTYYRKFRATPQDEKSSCYTLQLADNECTNEGDKCIECYVPTCVCLIASQPYFQVLKDCLTNLLSRLTDSTLKLNSTLLEFIPKLALIPVPPAGSVSVKFREFGYAHSLYPTLPYRPVCGLHLHHPFTLFSVDDILTIVGCILTEKQIVFFSSMLALLTPVIECFFAYVLPFIWRHVYIPVLPGNLIDYISAPGTFIMGCHAQFEEDLPDGIVAINLDKGTVVMNDTEDEIPVTLPLHAVELFKSRYRSFPKSFDLQTCSTPSYLDAEEEKQALEQHAFKLDATIRAAFVEMLAFIFRDVNKFGVFDKFHPVFKKQLFLDSQPPQFCKFYTKVCSTDLFTQFINDRLQRKQDYFDQEVDELNKIIKDLEVKQERSKKDSFFGHGFRRSGRRVLKNSESLVALKKEKLLAIERQLTVTLSGNELVLPEVESAYFTNGKHFYNICLEEVTRGLEQADTAAVRACYRYMRGMLHLASGRESDGTQDLQTVEKENRLLYPEKLLEKLTEKDEKPSKRQGAVDQIRMPRHDLNEQEFEKLTIQMGIFTDYYCAAKGWKCLSNDQYLSNDQFKDFVENWKALVKTADLFELPDDVQLEDGEDILLISGCVSHSQGIGRLVLTPFRLLVVQGAVCQQVMMLTDIMGVEKYTSLFRNFIGRDGLKLTLPGGQRLIVNLKEASDLWQLYIEELIAANKMAYGHKNPSILHSAAANVVAVHVLHEVMLDFDVVSVTGASDGGLSNSEDLLFCRGKENIKLPPLTFDALDCIVFPPSYDLTRKTIECMHYTPDKRKGSGRLWCGFGTSLLVCDVASWNFDFPIPIAQDRISCIAAVGESVWVGSLDKKVYVVSIESTKVDRSLSGHDDLVIGIITQQVDETFDNTMCSIVNVNNQLNGVKSFFQINKTNMDSTLMFNGLFN